MLGALACGLIPRRGKAPAPWRPSLHTHLFDFLDGLQDDMDLGNAFDFFDPDFGAYFTFRDAFDFDSISSGSFKYDNVSCEFRLSVGNADVKRSTGRIVYFNLRTLRNHAGTNISCAVG